MAKAAEAFRTISEVADTLDVPKHVLRFWELRFPQIKPMKRGGGRRYYRPADVELLRGIRHLLHAEGYTIKGVQKILREHGIDQVKSAGRPGGDLVLAEAPKPVAPTEVAESKPTTRKRKASGVAVPSVEPAAPAAPPVASADRQRMTLEKILDELKACRGILAAASGARVSA